MYIVLPNFFVLLFFFSNKDKKNFGSDHALHLRIIKAIKNNKNRFCTHNPFSAGEKIFAYPQLMHWILSFLPSDIYTRKPYYISLFVKIADILSFNLFLLFLYKHLNFEPITFLYANIVFNVFPLSYAAWNAKNMGLSARYAGLVFGQIYIYLIFFYVYTGNIYALPAVFAVVFILLLLSQMAFQFVLFSLPFFVLFFGIPELLLMPFLAFALFYVMMPKVAKSFGTAQYNHKRNYALFLSEIYILKKCYSVYRDFVYDFWKILKNEPDKYKALFYISKNPIVEILYGMPFLWFVLYYFFFGAREFSEEISILINIVFSSLIVFFLTTFRKTRFLGEPQRYPEFVIPAVTILFVLLYSSSVLIWTSAFSILIITAYLWALKKSGGVERLNAAYIEVFELLKKYYPTDSIVASNDGEQLRFLLADDFQVCTPVVTKYYKNKQEFQKQFLFETYKIISPFFIQNAFEKQKPDIFILNKALYAKETLLDDYPDLLKNYKLEYKVSDCEIYGKL